MVSKADVKSMTGEGFKNPLAALLAANFLCNFSVAVNVFVIGWQIVNTSASMQSVALVQSTQTLPLALLCISFGVLADLLERRAILLTAQLLALCATIGLLVVVVWFSRAADLLLTISMAIGCCVALTYPAWQACLGDLVEPDALPAAVSANATCFNIARILGPACGGALVALMGSIGAVAVSAVGHIAFICVLYRWRPTTTRLSSEHESLWATLKTGLNHSLHDSRLHQVLVHTLTFALLACILVALLPAVIRQSGIASSWAFGAATSFFGCGAICAGTLAAFLRKQRVGRHCVLALAYLGVGVSASLLAIGRSLECVAVASFLGGISWVMGFVHLNTSVHVQTPRPLISRTLALYQTVNAAGIAVGSWSWGTLADMFGLANILLVVALLAATLAVLSVFRLFGKPLGTV